MEKVFKVIFIFTIPQSLRASSLYTREPVKAETFLPKSCNFFIYYTGYLVDVETCNKAPLCKGSWISVGKTEGLSLKNNK